MNPSRALFKVAGWIAALDPSDIEPGRFDRLKRHIVDTVGARVAGSRLAEGTAIGRVMDSGTDDVAAAIAAACAQARCTEIDDIHLASCTTPGSVVVATALAHAAHGRLRSVGDCCAAALAGYETLIRFGLAIDGPEVLHRGVWPTHAAAAFGSAAAASRAYKLTVEQTAGALATALAFGIGAPLPANGPSSARWLTLGIAAANGELAARGACHGLLGTAKEMRGVALARLTGGIGRRFLFDDLGMKPFPTARQGLSAIEAARRIAQVWRLNPKTIDRIVVSLPELQRRVVDRPQFPPTRFASIVSVRYQIALALTAPERLADVERTPPFESSDLRRLLSNISVHRSRDLDRRYPRMWPARVEIASRGRRFTRVILHPHGDATRPLDWDDVAAKFVALTGPSIGDSAGRSAVRTMRDAGRTSRMPSLWTLK